MNLIEIEICQSIIDRLKTHLPAKLTDSIVPYPDKPEELSDDVLHANYPYGAYFVKYIESESDGTESMIFGAYVLAEGLEQTSKLTRAAKTIINGYAPFNGHKLKLHKDQEINLESGVCLRCISFAINHPAPTIPDSQISAKIEELEL